MEKHEVTHFLRFYTKNYDIMSVDTLFRETEAQIFSLLRLMEKHGIKVQCKRFPIYGFQVDDSSYEKLK